MKKYGLLLAILLVVTLLMGVVACETVDGTVIGVDNTLSRTFEVGSEVDFTKYFIIVSNGSIVPTTEDMLDLSAVNLTETGKFDVSCTYGSKSAKITFTIVDNQLPPVEDVIVVSVVGESSISVNIGAEIDFKSYFSISKNGAEVAVTDEMLDLTAVDLTKAGSFSVTCTYSEKSATLNVTVKANEVVPPVEDVIVVSVVGESSISVNVGAEIDFKSYFSISKNGAEVAVTDEMLDLTAVDLTKSGSFSVTCTYSEKSATLNVTVKAVESNSLSDILAMFADYDSWNFKADVYTYYNGTLESEYFYWYMGQNIRNEYTAEDNNVYVDYLQYDEVANKYWFVADYLEEGYYKYAEDTDGYDEYVSFMYLADPNTLLYVEFTAKNGDFVAKDPVEAGGSFIGEFAGETYLAFTIKVSNGKIAEIVAELDSGYKISYKFHDYGNVSFEIPDAIEDTTGGDIGGDDDDTPIGGSLISTFIAAKNYDLTVGSNELAYITDTVANGFANGRGVQFLQRNGEVKLTSALSVSNVTSVTIVVQTNAEKGMNVSVNVGNTALLSNGQKTVNVREASNFDQLTTLTFTSTTKLNGKVQIVLSPTQSGKSMYILSISINGSSSSGSSGGNTEPTETMEDQTYDEKTFDQDNLQDKTLKAEEAIGLPSIGDIDVLVIPVQFVGETITQGQLDRLKLAFNGTSADTGWESVKTFYQKSSYGKLNLSFDFTDIVSLKNNARYYENYRNSKNQNETGSDVILKEALSALDSSIDFSKYDTNGDGCIDAVYIIYSADVDYNDADFFWAYVTYYPNKETYDNVNPYYYMFAGFDFMDESLTATSPTDVVYPISINTMTYIHETGHLLGLDDYYDYYEELGANEGLGGADMMDYNIGDHGAYSKIMLGWMDATIVTSTQTLTISSLSTSGDCILVPLDFNNSYFSEYLLIDLYSATGLNELESKMDGSYLYDGVAYGVRIYHVSSQIDTPCDEDEYYSLTNYNNSITDIALIKLVEADGESNFDSTEGLASSSDLWHKGDTFSEVFSSYTRNDNKLINFDITIVSDSADSATITITFTE